MAYDAHAKSVSDGDYSIDEYDDSADSGDYEDNNTYDGEEYGNDDDDDYFYEHGDGDVLDEGGDDAARRRGVKASNEFETHSDDEGGPEDERKSEDEDEPNPEVKDEDDQASDEETPSKLWKNSSAAVRGLFREFRKLQNLKIGMSRHVKFSTATETRVGEVTEHISNKLFDDTEMDPKEELIVCIHTGFDKFTWEDVRGVLIGLFESNVDVVFVFPDGYWRIVGRHVKNLKYINVDPILAKVSKHLDNFYSHIPIQFAEWLTTFFGGSLSFKYVEDGKEDDDVGEFSPANRTWQFRRLSAEYSMVAMSKAFRVSREQSEDDGLERVRCMMRHFSEEAVVKFLGDTDNYPIHMPKLSVKKLFDKLWTAYRAIEGEEHISSSNDIMQSLLDMVKYENDDDGDKVVLGHINVATNMRRDGDAIGTLGDHNPDSDLRDTVIDLIAKCRERISTINADYLKGVTDLDLQVLFDICASCAIFTAGRLISYAVSIPSFTTIRSKTSEPQRYHFVRNLCNMILSLQDSVMQSKDKANVYNGVVPDHQSGETLWENDDKKFWTWIHVKKEEEE